MKKSFLLFCIIVIVLQFIQAKPSQNILSHIPNDANYICFVDFGKLSCYDRFYIYDVKKEKYIYSSRVQHGNGGKSTALKPEFSNKIGNNCSSLGLYKVTSLGRMKNWPNTECFRLRGLSSSNSNAEKRGILIHSSVSLSTIPIFPGLIIIPLTSECRGCFAVSIATMQKLKECYKKGNIYYFIKPSS